MRNLSKDERIQLITLPEIKGAAELEELRCKRRLKRFGARQTTSHFFNALVVRYLTMSQEDRDTFIDEGIDRLADLLERDGAQQPPTPWLPAVNNFFGPPIPSAPRPKGAGKSRRTKGP